MRNRICSGCTARSDELRIPMPMSDAALKIVLREIVRRNSIDTGIVYLQVTRGVAPRDHAFPKSAKPTLVVTSRASRPPDPRQSGGRDRGHHDLRTSDGRRCDIKSIALVANVLGKQQAREAGAFEAWQVDGDGRITEGTSTNAWIVTGDDTVVTRAADNAILNGVTRLAVLDIIAREGYRLDERPFTVEEAKTAREAFLTSTTSDVLPVVRIDGAPVGDGKPGPLEPQIERGVPGARRRSRHDDFRRIADCEALVGLRPPRAILFDWDNTLVDSWATIHEALNFLMRAMDKPEWSLADTKEKVRLSLREAFPMHFGERWEEARDIYLERFRDHPSRPADPAARARGDAARPGGAGDLLGVVSNKTGDLLRREVARLGWSDYFGSIVGAGDAPLDKPACDPVHLALAPSGVPGRGRRMVCRRYRGRYGMRPQQRLRRGVARRPRCRRGVFPGVCALCAAACPLPTRQACFAGCRACGSRPRAHLRRR